MRIMAIDYGDAHTGAAVSDLTGLLAGYTETIHTRRQEEVLSRLGELIGEYGVEELVLGYPKNMDGTLGPRAEKAEAMARTLEERFGLPVKLWDERRTTIDAHNILAGAGQRAKKRKKTVDAVAAALILEGYLTWRRSAGHGACPIIMYMHAKRRFAQKFFLVLFLFKKKYREKHPRKGARI